MAFEDTNSPNVTTNSWPNHADPKINAILEDNGFIVQRDVWKVKTPMIEVFKALVVAKIIFGRKEEEEMEKKGFIAYSIKTLQII